MFARWREGVAAAAGFPPLMLMDGFYPGVTETAVVAQYCGIDLEGLPIPWAVLRDDPLVVLLSHSDCDGEIAVKDCDPLADRLEEIVPILEARDADATNISHHRRGMYDGYAPAARRFAAGLREAAKANEPVDFH